MAPKTLLSHSLLCSLDKQLRPGTQRGAGKQANPCAVYAFAVFSVCTASGGLIYGYGPFINRLVSENVLSASQTQIIFANAFQVMTGFALLWTLHLHLWGPRLIASSGALLASLGNLIIALTLSMETSASTVYILLCGYGLVGGGGIGIYLASMSFAHLFPDKAFRISVIVASLNVSGCVYCILSIKSIPLPLFFQVYTAYTLILVVLFLVLYPSIAYDETTSVARVCVPLGKWQCNICPLSPFKLIKNGPKTPRFWLFAAAFSWETVIMTWIQGALLERYPHVSSLYKNFGFPFICNASYLVGPLVGKLIDHFGFVGILCLNILAVQFGLVLLYFDTVAVQWATLFSILLMNSCTYSVQMAFLTLAFPSHMFPGLVFVTILIQFLVDLTGVFLTSKPWGTDWIYYLVFLFAPTVPLYLFPILQWREEKKRPLPRKLTESPRSTRVVGMARRWAGSMSPPCTPRPSSLS